jgi:hypothetical protein
VVKTRDPLTRSPLSGVGSKKGDRAGFQVSATQIETHRRFFLNGDFSAAKIVADGVPAARNTWNDQHSVAVRHHQKERDAQ